MVWSPKEQLRIEAIKRHRVRMDNPRIPNGRDACLLKNEGLRLELVVCC